MINYRNSLRLCLIAILCGVGVSCRTVSTTAYPTATPLPPSGEAVGFPYFLPKGMLTLRFVAGTATDPKTRILLAPEIVADNSTTYFLRPVRNATFEYKHTYEVDEQGLLKQVSTLDTGKADSIATNLGALLIEVAKFGSGWSFHASDVNLPSVILPDDASRDLWFAAFKRPSAEEIASRLDELANQRLSLLVDGLGDANAYESETLKISITSQRSATNGATGYAMATKSFSGLLARTNDPHAVTLQISLDMRDIYRGRLAGSEGFLSKVSAEWKLLVDEEKKQTEASAGAVAPAKAYEDLKVLQQLYTDTVVALAKSVLSDANTENRTKLADATKIAEAHAVLVAKAEAAKTTAEKAVASANEQIIVHRNRLALYQYMAEKYRELSESNKADWYLILNESVALKYPDATSTVALPILRSPVGKSTHTITLSKGVLTKQESEEPSTVAGIVSVPLNLAKEVIKIPAEIVTFHLGIPTKELALADKELEVVNKKIDIATREIELLQKQEALRLKEKELEDKKKAETGTPAPKPAPDDQPKS